VNVQESHLIQAAAYAAEAQPGTLVDRMAMMRAAYSAMPDLVWISGARSELFACNPAFEEYAGAKEETLRGRAETDLLEPEAASAIQEQTRLAHERGTPVRAEVWMRYADGRRELFEVTSTPLNESDGKRLGTLNVGHKITMRQQTLDLAQNMRDLLTLSDADGTVRYMSPSVSMMLGYAPAELVGKNPVGNVHPNDFKRVRSVLKRVLADGHPPPALRYRVRHRNGEWIWLSSMVTPVLDADGKVVSLQTLSRDVTERQRNEAGLRLYRTVFDTSHSAIVLIDEMRRIIDVNPAFAEMTGRPAADAIGRDIAELWSELYSEPDYLEVEKRMLREGSWRGETIGSPKDGRRYRHVATVSAAYASDSLPYHCVATMSDVTQLREQQLRLERLAHYDALTMLPSRVLLADRLQQAMARARRNGRQIAICYMDLDGFKPINDHYGHDAGDRVLILIAQRLEKALRETDTLARLGGDEFALLLTDLASPQEGEHVLERLLSEISQPINILPDTNVTVSASVGVTFFPADDDDPETLLRHADQAMYLAKRTGRNRYYLFDAEMERIALTRQRLRSEFATALKKGQLRLYYEPKVDMRAHTVIGAEGLIRWLHPERGLVMPGEFLPAIENTELDVALGEWVISAARGQIEQWEKEDLQIAVSINIATRHLQHPRFSARLTDLLGDFPSRRPGRLELEIVERGVLNDIESLSAMMRECRANGVSFALDDFGTGYSSLSHLRSLPTDTVKIDRSFVAGILDNPDDRALIAGVIGMAKSLHRMVIAEGVENMAQAVALLELGCEFCQGYGIARPMPADRLPGWIAWYRKAFPQT
jgi:diguanylate cyclase (GGDEF)-like protein/PAS domain S-box-containing protein